MRTRSEEIQGWINIRKEREQTSKMIFYITVPNVDIDVYKDEMMQTVSEMLDRNNVRYNFVDTVPSAWNLNRDWIETEPMESIVEFCGVYPVDWHIADVVTLEDLESKGKIIILATEITEDGKYVPNH